MYGEGRVATKRSLKLFSFDVTMLFTTFGRVPPQKFQSIEETTRAVLAVHTGKYGNKVKPKYDRLRIIKRGSENEDLYAVTVGIEVAAKSREEANKTARSYAREVIKSVPIIALTHKVLVFELN